MNITKQLFPLRGNGIITSTLEILLSTCNVIEGYSRYLQELGNRAASD